ncbi:hypothetical protein MMC16_004597 [Acarospora aff. strigata]|nr:hypothetical protein [Acarospora aff. strigata]
MSRVEQLEQAIKDYQNVFDVFNTGDSEAALNARRDRFHCAEAWRQALLIYILRVFKPRSGSTQKISLISRVVLDHVRSIRQIDLVQKQVLLPVFLAGSEISDDYGRQSAQNYCDFWTEKNRYFLFSQARLLLEEVWKERKDSEIDDFWWGVVVDRHEQESPEQISYQYLLG